MERMRQEARRELEDRFEIRLAGEGGQGMILAGVILAEAAVYDGLNVVQTQDYGAEARGGASRSEVILSHGEIDYPKPMLPDFLLCMSQEACDRFYAEVRDDGCVVIDISNVSRVPSHRCMKVPVTEIAEEVTGRRITASMVALGLIAGLTGLVSRESLERAVRERVPTGTEEMNLRAVDAGLAEAAKMQASGSEAICG